MNKKRLPRKAIDTSVVAKIGIDLSWNSCGICVIIDNKTIYAGVKTFIHRKLDVKTYQECKDLIEQIIHQTKSFSSCFDLFIELGNYGNARMTQKFCGLASMLVAAFVERIGSVNTLFINESKIITPSQWFGFLLSDRDLDPSPQKWPREKKKELSKKLSGIKQDDVADAYWIAYYGNRCKPYYDN